MGTSLYNALKVKEPEACARNGKESSVDREEWVGGKVGDEIIEETEA